MTPDAEGSVLEAFAGALAECRGRLVAEGADAACDGAFGDLEATLDEVIAQLLVAPVLVDVTDPTTGQVVQVPVTPADVTSILFSLFYVSSAVPAIPAVIDGLGEGDFRPLVELSSSTSGQLLISQGMQLSFLCAEEVDRTSPEAVTDAAASLSPAAQLLVASNPIIGLPVFDLCEMWDVEPADPITFAPVTTDVSTLVVTGRFDQITPPRYGEEVAAALSDATLLEVPDGGHSPLFGLGPCGLDVLAAYLDAPTAVLDTGCATERQVQFLPDLPPIPQARSIADACPPATVPTGVFGDVAGVHGPAIECIAWWGVTQRQAPGRYAPGGVVTRGQMASFIARLIVNTGGVLPDAPTAAFADTSASIHGDDIDRLGAAGVVEGRTDGTFGPDDLLTRDQMASFLVRAYEHRVAATLAIDGDYFSDDTTSVHHDNINKAAAAGFTHGFTDGTYGPGNPLNRDAIASFLARELDLLVETGTTALPAGP